MISNHPHLIDLDDYPAQWWLNVVDLGEKISKHPEIYSGACHNKIMATLFYEPSTRTQMSFQTAMLRLGGRLIGFDNPANSSVSKGETLKDTTKIVSSYADILVMRHPVAGAAKAAALSADCPVINAGDSGHLHPTQTLTDLLTLKCEKGRLDHLTIGLCGDLINGRTVHSLVNSLVRYPGNEFYFISPEELKVPDYLVEDTLKPAKASYHEVSSLEETLPELDVLYMTRVQKERFFNEEDYIRLKDIYILDQEKLNLAKADMPVLHPLPRVDEIAPEVDADPRAAYFQQVLNGKFIRMALILSLLDLTDPVTGKKVFLC